MSPLRPGERLKRLGLIGLISRSARLVGLVIECAEIKGPLIADGRTSNAVRFVLLAFLIVTKKILSIS